MVLWIPSSCGQAPTAGDQHSGWDASPSHVHIAPIFVAEPWFSYSCLEKCHSGAKCSSPSLCLAFSCRLLLFFLFLPSLGISV